MRILVSGAQGMLGQDLVPALREHHEVIALSRRELDITVHSDVAKAMREGLPDLVINCAAYTQVDKAEEERGLAFLNNATGVQNLALACQQNEIPLCHVSTDYVFNGLQGTPYIPSDNTDPRSVYGASKRAGEKYIEWLLRRFYIVRTSWLYGTAGNNFVKTIRKLGRERPELRVVHDQIGSPTSTVSLAKGIRDLVATGAYGIYHYTDKTEGGISWCDFAREILKASGIATPVTPITTEEFPRPAPRPRYSVLDTSSYTVVTGHDTMDWKAALKTCLSSL